MLSERKLMLCVPGRERVEPPLIKQCRVHCDSHPVDEEQRQHPRLLVVLTYTAGNQIGRDFVVRGEVAVGELRSP